MVLFQGLLESGRVAYARHVLLSLQPDRQVERREGLQLARKRSLLFIGMQVCAKNLYIHVYFGIAKCE